MRSPRFLWVPFELGRQFGAPNEPDFQRRVLRTALELLDRADGPVVLTDFPDDAPVSEGEGVWSCPVSFAPQPSDEPALVEATLAEIRRLAPWAELPGAKAFTLNSGMDLAAMVRYLGALVTSTTSEDVAEVVGQQSVVELTRLVADDLRTWYLVAARRQPGSVTTAKLNAWFWQETAVARLLGEVAGRLLRETDPIVRAFATRALVPREHVAALVPRTHDGDKHSVNDIFGRTT